MKKLLIASMLSVVCSASAFAQDGYLTDSSGAVVKSGSGLCWNSKATFAPRSECGDIIEQPKKVEELVKPQVLPGIERKIGEMEAVGITLQSSLLFKFDSAQLSKAGEEALDKQVVALNPTSVEIIGHTDQIGTQKYNLKLSKKRAESVKSFLVSKGIDEKIITTTGMGETQLLCTEQHPKKSSACSEKNRRVEIKTTTFNH
jgi:OOP family OmpA-OmpF porin